MRSTGESIVDLTESNPTRVGISYPESEILEALSDPASLEYRPRPFGLEPAREAVAAYYAGRGQAGAPDAAKAAHARIGAADLVHLVGGAVR